MDFIISRGNDPAVGGESVDLTVDHPGEFRQPGRIFSDFCLIEFSGQPENQAALFLHQYADFADPLLCRKRCFDIRSDFLDRRDQHPSENPRHRQGWNGNSRKRHENFRCDAFH